MKEKQDRFCALANGLKALSVISILAGFICAFSLSKDYSEYIPRTNYVAFFNYIFGGILCALLMWSLSYIVDACDKYLKSNSDDNKIQL